jgi:hypothetical protein
VLKSILTEEQRVEAGKRLKKIMQKTINPCMGNQGRSHWAQWERLLRAKGRASFGPLARIASLGTCPLCEGCMGPETRKF